MSTGRCRPQGHFAIGRPGARQRRLQRQRLASAEIYDPVLGTWSLTRLDEHGPPDHTATLLSDGRVLVVGGHRQL